MRVLVIGGTGLLSTAIVERLLSEGHTPVLFNRGQSPSRLRQPVETVHGDRTDFQAFARTIKNLQFDAVIDMITFDAATATHAVQVFAGRVKHYVFCSTVCVYGGILHKIPANESEPHKPSGDYGRGKSEAEAVFLRAHTESGFPVTMMRPAHCYGEGGALLSIFGYDPTLVPRIRNQRPILVAGDGFGLWHPVYIGDIAKGFVGCLGRAQTIGKAYNIVGDEVLDWRTFHEIQGKALGKQVEIACMTTEQILAVLPPETGWMLKEIFQYHAAFTNDRLKSDVPEFTDLLSYEEGVRRTVAWLDGNNGHAPLEDSNWVDTLIAREQEFRRSLGTAAPTP